MGGLISTFYVPLLLMDSQDFTRLFIFSALGFRSILYQYFNLIIFSRLFFLKTHQHYNHILSVSNIHLAQKHMLLSHTRTVTVVMSFHIDIEISRLRISNPKEYHSSTKLKFIARISRRSILSQQLKY